MGTTLIWLNKVKFIILVSAFMISSVGHGQGVQVPGLLRMLEGQVNSHQYVHIKGREELMDYLTNNLEGESLSFLLGKSEGLPEHGRDIDLRISLSVNEIRINDDLIIDLNKGLLSYQGKTLKLTLGQVNEEAFNKLKSFLMEASHKTSWLNFVINQAHAEPLTIVGLTVIAVSVLATGKVWLMSMSCESRQKAYVNIVEGLHNVCLEDISAVTSTGDRQSGVRRAERINSMYSTSLGDYIDQSRGFECIDHMRNEMTPGWAMVQCPVRMAESVCSRLRRLSDCFTEFQEINAETISQEARSSSAEFEGAEEAGSRRGRGRNR